ncbi:unnamed protein product [Clavelina lepadiformis]|uniref:Uncharacterized protein n=1 Tax=Clavelina lepadiformis TaxID=159417 RepID=A0ABP0GSQ7_CLALP
MESMPLNGISEVPDGQSQGDRVQYRAPEATVSSAQACLSGATHYSQHIENHVQRYAVPLKKLSRTTV